MFCQQYAAANFAGCVVSGEFRNVYGANTVVRSIAAVQIQIRARLCCVVLVKLVGIAQHSVLGGIWW